MSLKPELRILLVYGYHPQEKFAVEVGRNLEGMDLNGAMVRRYDGPPDVEADVSNLNRFVKKHISAGYGVVLHSMSEPGLSRIILSYYSRHMVKERVREGLYDNLATYEGDILCDFAEDHGLPENIARIHLEYNTYGELLPLGEATSITVEMIELLKKILQMKR